MLIESIINNHVDMDAVQKTEIVCMGISITLYGLYHETFSAAMGVVMLALLISRFTKTKSFKLPKNLFLFTMIVLPVFALVSLITAVDRGMGLLGLAKFPVVAFFVILLQYEPIEFKEKLLRSIPYITATLTMVGLICMLTPLKTFFDINGRFSGTFQYANSYALLILCSLIIVLYSFKNKAVALAIGITLSYGLLVTGSRAVAVLAIVNFIVWGFRNNRKRLVKAGIAGSLCITAFAVFNFDIFNRLISFDFKSSSLISRLIYNADGINIMINNPLGVGYKGFLFCQGAVQTANYSSTYVHNELLQTALDFGILPALAAGAGIVMAVCKKGIPLMNRMILISISVHSLFDWSLQFPAILMILVLAVDMDVHTTIEVPITKKWIKGITALFCTITTVFLIWIGSATFFEYIGNYRTAATIYPGLTSSQMQLLNESNTDERYELANSICKRNDYCVIALQAMAEEYYKKGNIEGMEQAAMQAVKAGKYNVKGYEFYIMAMNQAYQMLQSAGDVNGAYTVLVYINRVPDIIKSVEQGTSPLAVYLDRNYEITLGEEYQSYLNNVNDVLANEAALQNE